MGEIQLSSLESNEERVMVVYILDVGIAQVPELESVAPLGTIFSVSTLILPLKFGSAQSFVRSKGSKRLYLVIVTYYQIPLRSVPLPRLRERDSRCRARLIRRRVLSECF